MQTCYSYQGGDRFEIWPQPVRVTPMTKGLTLFILIGLLIQTGCSTPPRAQRERTAQAHYKLGISYLNDNRFQQAFVEFQKAVEANPKERDARYALGHIYFIQGKMEEAQKEFKIALRSDTDFSEAHNYLGKVYERKGEWEQAISEYKKALKNPKYATPHFAHYNLGIAFINTSNDEGALKEFEEALRIDPSYSPAYQGRGEVYFRNSRYKEAIGAFQQALRLTPDNPDAHYNLGEAFFREGSRDQAREEFEKVIKLAPEGELAKNSKEYLDRLR